MNLHLAFPSGPLADAAAHILGTSALADVVETRGNIWARNNALNVKITADVYESLSTGEKHLWALLNSFDGTPSPFSLYHTHAVLDERNKAAVAAAMGALMGEKAVAS